MRQPTAGQSRLALYVAFIRCALFEQSAILCYTRKMNDTVSGYALRFEWFGRLHEVRPLLIDAIFARVTPPSENNGGAIIIPSKEAERRPVSVTQIERFSPHHVYHVDSLKAIHTDEHVGIQLRVRVDVHNDRSIFFSSDGVDERGEPILPYNVYSPFRPRDARLCAVTDRLAGVRVVVTSAEVARYCYSPRPLFLSRVLSGELVSAAFRGLPRPIQFDGIRFVYDRSRRRREPEPEGLKYARARIVDVTRRAILTRYLEGNCLLDVAPAFFGPVVMSGRGFSYESGGLQVFFFTSLDEVSADHHNRWFHQRENPSAHYGRC